MAEKVFETANLLAIFDASLSHGDRIGIFRSKRMVGDLPPHPIYESHVVFATTTASFSEKNLWLIVEHGIFVSDAGLYRLPEDHPYRQSDFGELTIERGLSNSADIMRKVMAMAAEWTAACRLDCPAGTIDEHGEVEAEPEARAVAAEPEPGPAAVDEPKATRAKAKKGRRL